MDAFPRNCRAGVRRNNAGISNKRGRHLYVTHTLLGGPGVLVLSSSADTISAGASTGVETNFGRFVPRAAGVVVTREVDSIVSTSVVVVVSGNGVSTAKARDRLVRDDRVCHRVCRRRVRKNSDSRTGTWDGTGNYATWGRDGGERARTNCGDLVCLLSHFDSHGCLLCVIYLYFNDYSQYCSAGNYYHC